VNHTHDIDEIRARIDEIVFKELETGEIGRW